MPVSPDSLITTLVITGAARFGVLNTFMKGVSSVTNSRARWFVPKDVYQIQR
jgi:hypothetical protein